MGKSFHYLIYSFFILLLTACAQVGSVSGGAKDTTSPTVLKDGLTPPNGSLNFTSKTIEMDFDEYIKLNNPKETVVIVPEDAKIKTEIKRKKVILTLDGNLKPSTTYAIYLNGTVQDITEGNDSLMQYVFSTGDFIDTLKYIGYIQNSYTYEPVKGVLVGLYDRSDSSEFRKPSYFSQTDAQGKFEISYIKAGEYKQLAFEDANKDLKFQLSEKVAFIDNLIKIDSSLTDTIPFLLTSPKLRTKVNLKYTAPSWLTVSSTDFSTIDQLTFDGNSSVKFIKKFAEDSLLYSIPFPTKSANPVIIDYAGDRINDTLSIRIGEKDKIRRPLALNNLREGKLPYQDTLTIEFSDRILAVNAAKIRLTSQDSILVAFRTFQINDFTLGIFVEGAETTQLQLTLADSALQFENYVLSFSLVVGFSIQKEEELGILQLDVSALPDFSVVEMLRNGKVVKYFKKSSDSPVITFSKLIPDTYTFRVVMDENRNGRWDDGSYVTQKQAEKVIYYKEGVKIRANWEIEASLTLNEGH